MKHFVSASRLLAVLSLLAAPLGAEPEVGWTVDLAGAGPAVSPTMHGLFFEDINYAADGGLYAELVENRSFEHRVGLHAWREEKRGAARGSWRLAEEAPIHRNNPRFLRLEIAAAGTGYGVANLGYGGIPVKAGEAYRFALHARAAGGFTGGLIVRLESAGGAVLAERRLGGLTADWRRHERELTSSATDTAARLVVLADTTGRVDLDMISLFPVKTWKGRKNGLRADLAQLLADMKPGFMRFPGGCIIEGHGLANAYRWKDTVGDIAERKQNWNRWTQQDPARPDHHYHQTYGLGFFEYFQFCEDIGAAPVPVLNCGMGCQFQGGELVPMSELDPWVQDALDLVEFANGPVTTKWGKLRADMGHPEPFGLKYLGVGNEQWGEAYFERYAVFHAALKARYPELVLITTSGPGVDDGNWNIAWEKFRAGVPAEVVDEHYYRPPAWFLSNAARYDAYPRLGDTKVFAGEFAAHRGDRASTLDVAVSEAAFMTGLLRNADLVTMTSYAPLLAREGYVQWTPDLIWFDGTHVMPTPSYHVQALYGRNRPDRILPSAFVRNEVEREPRGRVGVGTWQTQAEYRDVTVKSGDRVLWRAPDGVAGWDLLSGDWSAGADGLRQTGDGDARLALGGGPMAGDYTLTLQARKTGGREGFLIAFETMDARERSWWNIGGWGNTAHALQLSEKEYPRVPGSIETGRWYDIRVEVKADTIRCFLDGALVHDVRRESRPRVYGVAGLDETTGEVIVHVSNPSGRPQVVALKFAGRTATTAAQGWVLTAADPGARNSLDRPDAVEPRRVTVQADGDTIRHELPAWSHTVLRVKR